MAALTQTRYRGLRQLPQRINDKNDRRSRHHPPQNVEQHSIDPVDSLEVHCYKNHPSEESAKPHERACPFDYCYRFTHTASRCRPFPWGGFFHAGRSVGVGACADQSVVVSSPQEGGECMASKKKDLIKAIDEANIQEGRKGNTVYLLTPFGYIAGSLAIDQSPNNDLALAQTAMEKLISSTVSVAGSRQPDDYITLYDVTVITGNGTSSVNSMVVFLDQIIGVHPGNDFSGSNIP